MSLYEISQPPIPHFNHVNPFYMDDYLFPTPFPSTASSLHTQSSLDYLETIFSDDCMVFPVHLWMNTSTDDFRMDLDEFDSTFSDIPNSVDETEEREENHHQSQSIDVFHDDDYMIMKEGEASMDVTSMQPSLVLPFEGMEVDNHLCLLHLLRAYEEAMEDQQIELSEVIAQRVIQKANPVGGIMDRLLNYMFQHQSRGSDYLTQESIKNFYPAFKAFYQIFPYGKFAHFVVNSAILESLPRDVEIIHLIDFDIGGGIQWASLMEALKHKCKEIRVTSIRFVGKDDETSPFRWRFEETKRRLCDHAMSYGLKVKVEEVGLQDLGSKMMNIKMGDYGRKSWFVFNLNVGLPHMGKPRSRKDVLEFLRLARDFLHHVPCWGTSRGIITYGDGDALHNDKINPSQSYSSFFDANFTYYQALLESMESNFPNHLGEALIALETLFVAPNASTAAWGRKWEERRQCGEVMFSLGLERLELSEAILHEAKELVKEGVSLYGVRMDGEIKNEMEWCSNCENTILEKLKSRFGHK